MKLSSWRYVFLLLFLVALLAPRLTQLNHFVNSDERKWLARSANFYLALTQHDWVNTYQKEHPGVTVTWAGAAGFLWGYPAYAHETPGAFLGEDLDLEHFLRAHGQRELDLLIAGRVFLILMGAVALTLAFLIAQRLLGLAVATVGFLLIAFDPFHIALSRMLHIDGSEANFVCLALIAFLQYLLGGRQWRYLIMAGIAAGLAWLTKVPALFLAPFVGLLLLLEFAQGWWQTRQFKAADLLRTVGVGVAWGAIGFATVVIFWPAMWVDPIGTLGKVFGYALVEANGHGKPIYFDGEVIESFANPGGLLYPLTWLWRTTPVTIFGLFLALVAWVWPRPFQWQPVLRRSMAYLTLFAVAFLCFMTLGEKRFDRYLIPIYLPLDLVAAAGWMLALQGVAKWLQKDNFRRFLPTNKVSLPQVVICGVASALIVWQGALAWTVAPDYMAYYNPLVGGGPKAPSVMMIGWGEGIDDAAYYLNTKPNAANLRVAAWYAQGGFSYFFAGEQVENLDYTSPPDISKWLATDYFVTYVHQWQRQLPEERLLDHFSRYQPEKVITLNGIEYARIYNGHAVPPPPYLAPGRTPRYVDWGGAIRLLGYELPDKPLQPGAHFDADFLLQNLAPIDRNLNVLVRIVGADGDELLRSEGWPLGSPTSGWVIDKVWQDGHTFVLPPTTKPGLYRVELSFYDPATLDTLPAVDAYTKGELGPVHVVDYLVIGDVQVKPQHLFQPPVDLGGQITLLGVSLPAAQPLKPGATLPVTLDWQAGQALTTDYTSFVHLLGPDGKLVAQQDKQPQISFLATHLWQPQQTMRETYTLSLPADAQPGRYQLLAGLYDAAGQRLPVVVNGQALGDVAPVSELAKIVLEVK
ncbi:hypothetical protein BH10CHL1_BH10CHL1_39310 [soil metagenome]